MIAGGGGRNPGNRASAAWRMVFGITVFLTILVAPLAR